MTHDERREVLKIVEAHASSVGIAEACARTTRDLAAEVGRGSIPPAEDLKRTVAEAERVLEEFGRVRAEIERLIRHLA